MTETPPEHPSTTGHAEVDAVLETLSDLANRPVEEHVAVFEAADQRFRDVLSDAGPGPGPGGTRGPGGPGGPDGSGPADQR